MQENAAAKTVQGCLRSTSASNPVRFHRIITVEALLLTVLLHALLTFLVGVRSDRGQEVRSDRASVTLLSPAAWQGERGAVFRRWIACHDPALISSGTSRYGYARLAARPGLRQPCLTASALPEMPLPDGKSPAGAEIARSGALPARLQHLYPSAVPERTDLSSAAMPPAPFFRHGERFQSLPVTEEERRLIGEGPCGSVTLHLGSGAGIIRRFEITHGSGRKALDLLALRLILRSGDPDAGEYTVFWRTEETHD